MPVIARAVRWVALGVLLAVTAAGCVRVHPWERETFAARSMRADPDPAERKLDGHVEEFREGSIGGSGAGGGGCGCN